MDLIKELAIKCHSVETYIPQISFTKHSIHLNDVFLNKNNGRATVKNALQSLCEDEEASFTASFSNEIENITFYEGELPKFKLSNFQSHCKDIVEVTKPSKISYFEVSSEGARYNISTGVKRTASEQPAKFSFGNSITFTVIPKEEYDVILNNQQVSIAEEVQVDTPLCSKMAKGVIKHSSTTPACLTINCSTEPIALFKIDMGKHTRMSFNSFHERIKAALEEHGWPCNAFEPIITSKPVECPEEVTVMMELYNSDRSQLRLLLPGCYLLHDNMRLRLRLSDDHEGFFRYNVTYRPQRDHCFVVSSSLYLMTTIPLQDVKDSWCAEDIDPEMFENPKDKFVETISMNAKTFSVRSVEVRQELAEMGWISVTSVKDFKSGSMKEEIKVQVYDKGYMDLGYNPEGPQLFYLLCNAAQVEANEDIIPTSSIEESNLYDWDSTQKFDVETGVLTLTLHNEVLNKDVEFSINIKTRQATSLMVDGLHIFYRTYNAIMGMLFTALHHSSYTDCLVKFS